MCSSDLATTGITPFFANYGYHPQFNIKTTDTPLPVIVQDIQERMQKLDKYLYDEIRYAQSIQAEKADRHRLPSPAYQVGDLVWLLRRNFHTTRPSAKLDYKRVGKYRIVQKVSSHAYKLALPPNMKNHPVFYTSQLEPTATNSLQGQ